MRIGKYIYIFIYIFVLPHLVYTRDYISCTPSFTKDFSSGTLTLTISGEINTPLLSPEGLHNGIYIQFGYVLNNSFRGLPCDSVAFTPNEPLSGDCEMLNIDHSIWISPGKYIANFTSWNWKFTNILPFSHQLTTLTCRLHPYQSTTSYLITINDILIPGAMKNLSSKVLFEERMFNRQNVWINVTLHDSPAINDHGYLEIEFPPIEIVEYNICTESSFQNIEGNMDIKPTETICQKTNKILFYYENNTFHGVHKWELENLRNAPTTAHDYYKIRVSAFTNKNPDHRLGTYYRRETAAFFWNSIKAAELSEKNVGLSIIYKTQFIIESLDLNLISLVPKLKEGDIITINSDIFDTVFTIKTSPSYNIKSSNVRVLQLRVLLDDLSDIQIRVENIIMPTSFSVTNNVSIEITTSRYIYAINEYALIHSARLQNSFKRRKLTEEEFAVRISLDPDGSKKLGAHCDYLFDVKPNMNMGANTRLTIIFENLTTNGQGSATRQILGSGASPQPLSSASWPDKIYLNTNIYPSGYVCCYFMQIKVSGIMNPTSKCLLSEIYFTLTFEDDTNGELKKEHIQLEGEGSYEANDYVNSSVTLTDGAYSTATICTYNFTFKAISRMPITGDSIIKVTLPPRMRFVGHPDLTQIHFQGITNFPLIERNITLPDFGVIAIYIKDAVPTDSEIPQEIKFSLTHILNPYELGSNLTFGLDIAINLNAAIVENFYYQDYSNQLAINIDNIASISLILSVPLKTTNHQNNYIFDCVLGDGDTKPGIYIKFIFPPQIYSCDETTITRNIEGCTTPLPIDNKYKFADHIYGYKSICGYRKNEQIHVIMSCISPETKEETDNFTVELQSDKESEESIFYRSIGQSISMVDISTFLSTLVSLGEYAWQNRICTFIFSLNRAHNSKPHSIYIDTITLKFPSSLQLQSCDPKNITIIAGIVFKSPTIACNCINNTMSIENIEYLENQVDFSVGGIMSPLSNNTNNSIIINTGNGDNVSEKGITNSANFECEFPCKNCDIANTKNCTSCLQINSRAFDEADSLHMLYYDESDIGSCYNTCPLHTYMISVSACANCDINCYSCSINYNNCTKCYNNTYLHENKCPTSCPNEYIMDNIKWICYLTRGFEPESYIKIVNNTKEIEEKGNYSFCLKPEGGLFKEATIEITSPNNMLVLSPCNISLGVCSVSDSVITVNISMTEDYVTEDPCLQFTLIETYINPNLTYTYSSMHFQVETKVGSMLSHSGNITLNGGNDTYYSHELDIRIDLSKPSTATLTQIQFYFKNPGFVIAKGYSIYVLFPDEFTLVSEFTPQVIAGTLSANAYISLVNYPWICLLEGFPESSLPPNSYGVFGFTNILTPYQGGTTENFQVIIGPSQSLFQFKLPNGTPANNSLTISPFLTFTALPAILQTSKLQNYTFTLRAGDGRLRTGDRIVFRPPESVTQCVSNTITGIGDLTITSKWSSSGNYYFELTADLPPKTTFQFLIECTNPETTRPTNNFTIRAEGFFTDAYKEYYNSSSSSITMITLNGFRNNTITKTANFFSLAKNNFEIEIERTASYISKDINQIKITVGAEMNPVECSLGVISGILGGEPKLIISENVLYIRDFNSLAVIFKFGLNGIRNPRLKANKIMFSIETGNTEGYQGELVNTTEMNTTCNFPCMECTPLLPSECISCFPETHNVFEGMPEKLFLFYPGNSECISGSSGCPSGTMLESPVCSSCNIICKECDGLVTNCTECKTDRFLLDNDCHIECPSTHSENEINRTCDLILHFESGSKVIIDDPEVEKTVDYHFILKPEIGLEKEAIIEIISNPLLGVASTCSIPSTTALCVAADSLITIQGLLTTNYVPDSNGIEFWLPSVYTNPHLSFPFSRLPFLVQTKSQGLILHSGYIGITQTIAGEETYLPHHLGSPTVIISPSPSTTATKSKIIFNMINTDFQVFSGSLIRVRFPLELNLSTGSPEYIPCSLDQRSSMKIYVDSSYIDISDAFPVNLEINNGLEFEVDGILTPYRLGSTSSFKLYIGRVIEGVLYIQFIRESGLELSVNQIAQFLTCNVSTNIKMTNSMSIYEFALTVGDGPLRIDDQITFQVPVSIIFCDPQTITQVQGIIADITTKDYDESNLYYYFYIPEHIQAGKYFKFSISCQNPETEKPTEEFIVSGMFSPSESIKNVFYNSSAGGVVMDYTTAFPATLVTQSNPCALCNNTFTFEINRTSKYPSIDINQIGIKVGDEMDPSNCKLYIINGIWPINVSLSISEDKLKINNITSLEEQFTFRLEDIRNPPLRSDDMQFVLETLHSPEEYSGEKDSTRALHTSCDFPCATCLSTSTPAHCLSCNLQHSPVFLGLQEQPFIYDHNHHPAASCLSSCPLNYYIYNISDSFPTPRCRRCEMECVECEGISDNCSKCVPHYYLLENKCITLPCPEGYSPDTHNWECHFILNFEMGSYINIVDNQREIETPANYAFLLLPQKSLPKDADIEITSPHLLTLNTSCKSNTSGAHCDILGGESSILLHNELREDYLDSVGEGIQFEVQNTYVNPALDYECSTLVFALKTKVGNCIYHMGNISLSTAGYYLPHTLDTPVVQIHPSSTASSTNFSFSFYNTHPVPVGYFLYIHFPITFNLLPQTKFIPTLGLHHNAQIDWTHFPSYIIISAGFLHRLPPHTHIAFQINQILSPYSVGPTTSFIISIGTRTNKQFLTGNGLEVDILSIAKMLAFNVVSSTDRTCDIGAIYEFSFTVGDGPLRPNDILSINIPPAITNCTQASSIRVSSETGSASIINSGLEGGNINKPYFSLPIDVPARVTVNFTLECANPETTRPIIDFEIVMKATGDFYKSSKIDSNLTMRTLNTFGEIPNIEMSEVRPKVRNTLTLRMKRTSNYISMDINQIEITIPPEMKISPSSSAIFLSGLISGNVSVNIIDKQRIIIIINGTAQLEQTFMFELTHIHNPLFSTNDIKLHLRTQNIDGFTAEQAYTNTLYTLCDFPCQTCEVGLPHYCLSCFPQYDPVFESLALDLMNSFLHNFQCMAQCPSHYFPSISHWECLPCDSTCAECNSILDDDCTQCYLGNYLFPNRTCASCPYHYFYNFTSKICQPEKCSEGCLECSGLNNDECISCNIANGYYALENKPSSCLFLCHSETPLYINEGECLPCNSHCSMCFGASDTSCTLCAPPYYLGNNTQCLYTNCSHYSNTFPIEQRCEKCHESCNGCTNLANNCTTCPISYFLYIDKTINNCVIHCPLNYYEDVDQAICQTCPSFCSICERVNFIEGISTENLECVLCSPNYYLNSKKKCVSAGECGINRFANKRNYTCDLCNFACEGCEGGSTNSHCLLCRHHFVLTKLGSCLLFTCNEENQYLDHDGSTCKKCDPKCKGGCRGPGERGCISCQPWTFPMATLNSTIVCTECERVRGYFTNINSLTNEKQCSEVCGDGINLGEHECDDGNLIGGDGCSTLCEVEEGFHCHEGTSTSPDLCKDILWPQLAFNLHKSNILNHIFVFEPNKELQITTNKDPKTFVNITIAGQFSSYIFDYQLAFQNQDKNDRKIDDLANNQFYDSIIIIISPESSIMEDDMLHIVYHSAIFSDRFGNVMHGAKFDIKLFELKHLSPRDKKLLESTGNTMAYSGMVLFWLNLLLAIIFACSLSLLLQLFNMIQLILFIPLLELEIPENLRLFISDYLQFSHFNFEFLYNAFHRWGIIDLSEINYNPLNEKFALNGLKSRVLIVNYGGQLVIWSFVIFLYIPISLLAKCKIKKFIELKRAYEYGVLIASFSEAFLDFTLLSFLNITQFEFHSRATWISSVTGLLGMILAIGFIVLITNIISNLGKTIKNKENIQKFGILYGETNYLKHQGRRQLSQFFINIFLLRRLCYALIILFLTKFPKTQQIINIAIHSITFLYGIIMRPFSMRNILGLLIYFLDFVAFVIFVTLPLYLKPNDNANIIGRFHIYLITVTFALSWIAVICSILQEIYIKYKKPSELVRVNIGHLTRTKYIAKQPKQEDITVTVSEGVKEKERSRRSIAQERINEAGKKYLREQKSEMAKQRQREWRIIQSINNRENAEARQRSTGPVSLEIEIRRDQRIAAHKRKWDN